MARRRGISLAIAIEDSILLPRDPEIALDATLETMEKIEIVKIEQCPDDILIDGTTTEILFDTNTDIQLQDQPILVDCTPHADVKDAERAFRYVQRRR